MMSNKFYRVICVCADEYYHINIKNTMSHLYVTVGITKIPEIRTAVYWCLQWYSSKREWLWRHGAQTAPLAGKGATTPLSYGGKRRAAWIPSHASKFHFLEYNF